MIEKIEQLISVVKQFSSLEFMAKALIWLLVLVCLYEYDQDNLVNFRQCLMEKEWIAASLPLLNLLLTLTKWLEPVVGILFMIFLISYYLVRGYKMWLNFFCYILKIASISSCCALVIVVAHRVWFDDLIIHRSILPIDEHWEIWVPIISCVAIYIGSIIHFEDVLSKKGKNQPDQ